jgi:F-type H+-transporting ATPase subunit b
MKTLFGILAIAPEGAESPGLFSLTANVSFWTLVIFLVLLVILMKFAYPPILGYAEAREKRIQAALDEARHQREETARLLEEQRAQLAEARQQAQAVIAEGKVAAERIRQELVDKARLEQQELVARARDDIERERQLALESLRREAIDLAMAAAARLVGQSLQAEDDRRIVREYLEHTGVDTGAGVA